MSSTAKMISDCMAYVNLLYVECDHLCEKLKEQFSELLVEPQMRAKYQAIGNWKSARELSPNGGHMLHSIAWSQEVAFVGEHSLAEFDKKRESADRKHVFFQISLAGKRINASGNTEPLIYIGFWNGAVAFSSDKEFCMGFPLDQEDPPHLEHNTLMVWDSNPEDPSWSFTVRLAQINDEQAVKEVIMQPLRSLLLSSNPASVALNGIPGIVQFQPMDSKY
ncbi:hypothetical protein ACFQDN_14545 [Pseudomonas asuensis]